MTEEQKTSLFLSIVYQYSQTAFTAMGKIPNPATGEVSTNLELAQYCVDMLTMLEEKTAGNLTDAEMRELQQAVTNARLTFLQASSEKPQQPEKSQETEGLSS